MTLMHLAIGLLAALAVPVGIFIWAMYGLNKAADEIWRDGE